MSKINVPIPQQNFELVRDKIAQILALEFGNQYTLTGNELMNLNVWVERFIAFDKVELPAINVVFDQTNYNHNDANTSAGDNRYNIFVINRASHTASQRGDTRATQELNRIMGIARYIIMHPAYHTLDFAPGFIFGRNVDMMRAIEPTDQGDGTQTIAAQMSATVRMNEHNGAIAPVSGEIVSTSVKLAETDKGYYYYYET